MRPPRLIPNSPDLMAQLQTHFDLIWNELEAQKGVGGKTIRLLGPLDMKGLPIQNTTPSVPTKHFLYFLLHPAKTFPQKPLRKSENDSVISELKLYYFLIT